MPGQGPAHEAHFPLVWTQGAAGRSEFILTIRTDQLLVQLWLLGALLTPLVT